MKATLTHDAWHKMRAYVDLCPDEISGLAKVEIVEGDFLVTDVAIFEQVVSAAHSDIPAQALARFQVELIKRGENPKDWFCWWHSHAAMKTFFSGRDVATINESIDFKMMLSIVTNHAHEFSARFDLYDPVRMQTEVTVEVLEQEDENIISECKQQIAAKVTRPVPVYVSSRDLGFGAHDYPAPTYKKAVYEGYDKDDHNAYKNELAELSAELTAAMHNGDKKRLKEVQSEIYDKKVDGYYSGYEKKLPIKRV